MNSPWPMVKLGEVLRRSGENITILPDAEYREVTVRLWGKGVVLRGIVAGVGIAASRRFVTKAGQLILSRIDARNGAIGVVPSELDGAVVTNDFPLFDLTSERIDSAFLGWLTKTRDFVELCQKASEGTTNRVRLQEDRFLALEIPLPPLAEQQRIVARIEELAAKIEEARGLRQDVAEEAESVWSTALRKILVGEGRRVRQFLGESGADVLLLSSQRNRAVPRTRHNNAYPDQPVVQEKGPLPLPVGWVWTTLGSVLTHLVDCVNDTPDFANQDTGFIGLKSTNIRPYHLDLRSRWFMEPEDFTIWNRRAEPRARDIILTREAPMGYACILPDGYRFCLTQRLMLLRADPDTILPDLPLHNLNSPNFRFQVEDTCRGLTTPHIRVQDAPNFLLPLPPMDEQVRIVAELEALQVALNTAKRFQVETAAELDALLPSILDRAFKGDL